MRGNTGPVYQLWISPNTFDGEFFTIHFSHKHKGLLKLKRKENSSWIITFILFLWTRNFLLIIIIINFYRGSTNFTKKIMPFFSDIQIFQWFFPFFLKKWLMGNHFLKKFLFILVVVCLFMHFYISVSQDSNILQHSARFYSALFSIQLHKYAS